MNAAKQLAGRPSPGAGTQHTESTFDVLSGSSSAAAGRPRWWACHWPLLTAIAWAVLLLTIGTWWWLDNSGNEGQPSALGQTAEQKMQQTPAAPVATQAGEGLAWHVHQ